MSRHVRIALNLWPFVLGMLIVLGINRMEHWLFPVVSDFTVTTASRQGDLLRVAGYMRKDRNCVFAGVSADAVDSTGHTVSIPLVFRDNERDNTANRPTGTQGWGPWQLEIPIAPSIKEITLEAVHTCHPFWSTSSHLVTLPVVGVAP